MMYEVMRYIANALALCGLYPGDTREVLIEWRQSHTRPGVMNWRVKVGQYTVGWRIEQEV